MEKEKIILLIEEYNDGATPSELSCRYNIPESTIRYNIAKHGKLRTRSQARELNNKFLTKKYLANLLLSSKVLTTKQLSKSIGVDRHTFIKYLRKYNLEIPKADKISAREALFHSHRDLAFFDKIDTQDKAYILGMLAADGNVSSRGSSICLALKDEDVIIKINEYFKSNIRKRKNGLFAITVSMKAWKNALSTYDIVPNKSTILKFPETLKDDLIRHFIRGYFDGDGSISLCKSGGRYNPIISITSSQMFIETLSNILTREIECTCSSYEKDNCSTLSFGGIHNIKKMYDYLYKDSTIFMNRKKEKFEHILLNWNTRRANYTNMVTH